MEIQIIYAIRKLPEEYLNESTIFGVFNDKCKVLICNSELPAMCYDFSTDEICEIKTENIKGVDK